MKNKIRYIYFIFSIIFKSKWDLKIPQKRKILLIDGLYNPFKKYFKNSDFNILYRRGEKINLPVVIQCLKELRITSENYYKKFIEYSKPKIILTAFDHYPIFYKLSRLTGIKTLMLQRGKRTWQDGIFANKEVTNKKNKKNNYVDYILTHTEKTAEIYKTFIQGNYKIIGSFENNIGKKSFKKKKKEILYISNVKFDENNKIMPLNQFDHIVIKKIQELSLNNKLKFNIMGRHKYNKTHLEILYYKKILNKPFNFINKNSNRDSYKVIKNYEYIFTDYSTMGVETLASGSKVGFIFYKPQVKKLFDLRLGKFEGLKSSGPFWTAFYNYNGSEINRVFNFVVKSSNLKWTQIRKKYSSFFMAYDEGNKIFLNIIKKTLKK